MVWNLFFLTISGHYWRKVDAADREKQFHFAMHVLKGFAVPVLVWVVLNVGWIPSFTPFLPQTADLMTNPRPPGYVAKMILSFGSSLTTIGSVFSGVTLAMLLVQSEKRADQQFSRGSKLLIAASWTAGIAALVSVGAAATGFTLVLIVLPVLHFRTAEISAEERTSVPMYAHAEAHMKFGRIEDAESSIIDELEKEPDDFDGWMMLARIYAREHEDLEEAAATVHQLIRQPNVSVFQASLALNQLADWHLELASDPVAARAALTTILDLHPGTQSARMARIRRKQLPATREEWIVQHGGRTMDVGKVREFEQPLPAVHLPENLDRSSAADLANACSENLSSNPNDTAAREKLAILLGDHLGKRDEAISQMRLLLGLPESPPAATARWMNQIATWQMLESGGTLEARKTLTRLSEILPRTLYGFNAERRLILIESEIRELREGKREQVEQPPPSTARRVIKLSD